MKKKLLHLLIAFFAVATAARADEQHALIISFHEGDPVAVVLTHKPCATFVGNELVVEASDFSATYLRSAIADFHFGWYDPSTTSIDALPESAVQIVYTDENRVVIHGIDSATPITIYGIDGHRMTAHTSPSSNGIAIDLTAYPMGIYLININKIQTFKIIKK